MTSGFAPLSAKCFSTTNPHPTTMKQDLYDTILKETFKRYRELEDPTSVTLEQIEETATVIAAPLSPEGTYIPDIALQIAFDVIGMSSNEKLMRDNLVEEIGSYYKVAVGNTFIDENGEEDQDVSDRLIFVSNSSKKAIEAIEDHLARLSRMTGETHTVIEILEVIEI